MPPGVSVLFIHGSGNGPDKAVLSLQQLKPPEERNTYLYLEAYGLPETMGLAYKEAQAREDRAPVPGR